MPDGWSGPTAVTRGGSSGMSAVVRERSVSTATSSRCGDASVLVQVACGHRAESFEACRFLIDALKAQVPIWKREEWADGTTWSEGTPAEGP